MRGILRPLPSKESHRATIEKIRKVYRVRTYGNGRPRELVKREVQQLGMNPDLMVCTLRYHVVFSTRQRVNVFAREHGEPMADMIRQAAFPFEQTKVQVLWLASDH